MENVLKRTFQSLHYLGVVSAYFSRGSFLVISLSSFKSTRVLWAKFCHVTEVMASGVLWTSRNKLWCHNNLILCDPLTQAFYTIMLVLVHVFDLISFFFSQFRVVLLNCLVAGTKKTWVPRFASLHFSLQHNLMHRHEADCPPWCLRFTL